MEEEVHLVYIKGLKPATIVVDNLQALKDLFDTLNVPYILGYKSMPNTLLAFFPFGVVFFYQKGG